MSDQSQDNPGASGELPHWWPNVPKPLQHGTGEYQPPGYPTTTAFGIPTRFVPGPLNSGRLNQALDELQGQIAGFIAEAPTDGAAYGRASSAWTQVLPITGGTLNGTLTLAGDAAAALQPVTLQQMQVAVPVASTTTPRMDGTAAAGSATAWARGDHVHPTDTSRAPLASPALTGTPAAPTATPGTNTTQLATTAFVGAAVTAAASGVASFNTRTGAVVLTTADVTGAGGAPLASPALTGTPTAPTPTAGNNTTALATTSFVQQVAASLQQAAFNTNRADNSGFSINQRSYVSGAALAAGAYGHDRWKGGASGGTYTFTQSGNPSTTITITAGSLQHVVEGVGLAGGTYTLSWTGTAQGRIGASAYGASPQSAAVTAGANTTIEFNAGTVGQVKFEAGAVRTPWVSNVPQQDLAKCQRFYQQAFVKAVGGTVGAWGYAATLSVQMRANPTVVLTNQAYGNASGATVDAVTPTSVTVYVTVSAAGGFYQCDLFASADL
jgi:hypothetical protein